MSWTKLCRALRGPGQRWFKLSTVWNIVERCPGQYRKKGSACSALSLWILKSLRTTADVADGCNEICLFPCLNVFQAALRFAERCTRPRWDEFSAYKLFFILFRINNNKKKICQPHSTNVRLSAKREALSHAEHYSEQRGGKLRAGVPDSAESTLNIVWDTVVLSRLDSAELQHFHLVFFIWSFTVTFTFTTLSQLQ